MVMGAAAVFLSWTLADHKIPGNVFRETFTASDGMAISFIPPDTDMEFILLSCGLVILACSLWQWKKQVRYARIQIFSGSVITAVSAFLGIRSWILIATTGPLLSMDISNLYYLCYPALVCSVLVLIIGFAQSIQLVVRRQATDGYAGFISAGSLVRLAAALLLLALMLPFAASCGGGADEDALRGQMIPELVVYENQVYKNSGDIVAQEKAPQNVAYIGRASLDGQSADGSSQSSGGYEVYSIQGIEREEAIAVKFLLVGSEGAYYCYINYVAQD
jgi:hypothetical protein